MVSNLTGLDHLHRLRPDPRDLSSRENKTHRKGKRKGGLDS